MIEQKFKKINDHLAYEVQFRLGFKSLMKVKNEWIDLDQNELTYSEWEDLKEFCLSPNEKNLLEKSGVVEGYIRSTSKLWSFVFTENQQIIRAYFKCLPQKNLLNQIQFPMFLNSIKNGGGIYIISGLKGHGKSTLLNNIIEEINNTSQNLMAIFSKESILATLKEDTILHINYDKIKSIDSRLALSGVDQYVFDLNEVSDWNLVIKLAEEGCKVLIALSSLNMQNCLEKIASETKSTPYLFERFITSLQMICFQKYSFAFDHALHEILILNEDIKHKFKSLNIFQVMSDLQSEECYKNFYQSLNQSILQSLIRRKIDVKTAFQLTEYPQHLDEQLKRMGL